MKKFLIFLIRIYQICLSPFLGGGCRFYPTCSAYTAEAIAAHGAVSGTFLGVKRLLRCHPFSSGGYEPVEQ